METPQNIRDRIESKFTKGMDLVLFILSGIFVFTSLSTNIHQASSSIFLNRIFHVGVLSGKGPSVFDLVLSFFCFLLIRKFGINISKKTWQEKCVFISSIIYVIFLTINPNNHIQSFGLLGCGLDDNLVFLFFLYTLIFLKSEKVFVALLAKFISFICIFSVIRSIYLLLLFVLGKTSTSLFGVTSILMEDDTLYIFAFISLIFLLKYFLTRDKKYFLGCFFMLLIQIFSFRRGGTLMALFSSTILFLVHFIWQLNLFKKIVVSSVFFIMVFGISNCFDSMPSGVEKYFMRNFGALLWSDYNVKVTEKYILNRHIDQSIFAQTVASDYLDFWGKGYGPVVLDQFTYKSSRGIHNAFIQVWMKHGWVAYLYYVFLAAILAYEIIKTMKNSIRWEKEYVLVRTCIIIYLILLTLALWTNAMYLLVETKMAFFRMSLFVLLLRMTPQHYKILFTKGKKYRFVTS